MKPIDPSSPRAAGASVRARDPRPSALALLGAGAALAMPAPSDAATFTVTTLADAGAGSLRQAIADANAAAGADDIAFQAGLTGTITLTTGQLEITDSLTVAGPGPAALSVSGNNASRVFYLYNGGSVLGVTISGLTVTGGAASDGAGLVNYNEDLTLQDMVFTGNAATSRGGALFLDGFEFAFTLRDVVISGNSAAGAGGGIYIEDTNDENRPNLFENVRITGNTAGSHGGGVYLYDPDSPITLRGVTISGNAATSRGGGLFLQDTDSDASITIAASTISGNTAQSGGGVYLYQPDNELLIENSTISGNTGTGGGESEAAGVFLYDATYITIRHSTIAGNSVGAGVGGLVSRNGAVDLAHTIIGDNSGGANADVAGDIDARFSLVEAVGTATINDIAGNVLGQDPQLGALADNGGPTQTQRPGGASPALNAGDPAFVPPPATDQRGQPRVAGGRIDMGAVEVQAGTLQIVAAPVVVNEADGTASVTVTRIGGSEGSVTVDYSFADLTATQGADYTGVAGTLTFADGDTEETIVVPIIDDCTVENVESFTVTLANPGGGAQLGAAAQAVQITSDDAPGTLQFSSPTYNVGEASGTAAITVTRTGGTGDAVSADFATGNGSATAPADYTATNATVSFACGDAAPKVVLVPIVNDAAFEPQETVNLTLTNPLGGATLGAPAAAVLTIDSEDASPGTLGFSSAVSAVNETDGTVTLTVTRTGGSAGAASIDYATGSGTATAGADYTATAGTLTFADGVTSQNIVVPLINDCDVEVPKTFTVTLSNATGAAAGATLVNTVSITSEDTAGTLQFSAATYSVSENGGNAAITVTRTGGSGGAVSVNYAAANGTATSPADYAATAGTLNFACGVATAQVFNVPIVNDASFEPDETVSLSLSGPTGGAALGAPANATLTITNDDVAAAGTVQFNVGAVTVNEGDGTVSVTVTRTGGSDNAISVNYATSNGSAASPGDFTATAGTLTWLAGDATTRTIVIPLANDGVAEGDETFSIALSAPTGGATLGPSAVQAITIVDNDGGGAVFAEPITIDATGRAGKLALGGLLGLIGVLALRRRGLFGFLLACGLAFGALPQGAQAQAPAREVKIAQVSSVTRAGDTVELVFASGLRVSLPVARTQIEDHRAGSSGPITLDSLAGGQWVRVVRKPGGPKGRGEEIKISVYDSRERAERRR